MNAYNPIAVEDIEHIAERSGWKVTGRPTDAGAWTVELKRTEEPAGEVEIEVHCRGQFENEVEITHWRCSDAAGYDPGDWYDSRDDEFDHGTAEAAPIAGPCEVQYHCDTRT
ncbi:Uncharacterised protein [Mycobacteroides abscessus subsp. abscessus]|uniref:hypothetical protein n=1 Tax=Mycobacteroides abscessus TaxID=36809 RepID=UPI00092BE996|nr:hypothetical protein [Mycobacteroides abscessus]SHU66587.1 Uncharacterised protein [Mycobacteroides abscessus subsp. abscessus]